MASIQKDRRHGGFKVFFRWAGVAYCKSCLTENEKTANGVKARIDETLRLLRLGRVEIPAGADPGVWIFTEGKQTEKPKTQAGSPQRFDEVCRDYLADQHDKAPTTLSGERAHIKHLQAGLGKSTRLASVTTRDLQDYAAKQKTNFAGVTIRKHLLTFSQIWDWARVQGIVELECPLFDMRHRWAVKFEKPKDRVGQFKTLAEIQAAIARGGLTAGEIKELWSLLFLDQKQVDALLVVAKKKAPQPFVFPMLMFAAYTGARRSEVCRVRIEDIHFERNEVRIVDKKRKKSKSESVRIVPLHAKLADEIRAWLKKHPGGRFLFGGEQELSVTVASKRLRETLKNSDWKMVQGFHVLRHSFGANAPRSGIPRDIVAKWMGHTSQDMATLYQHIFQEDEQTFIRRFGAVAKNRR